MDDDDDLRMGREMGFRDSQSIAEVWGDTQFTCDSPRT